MYQEIITELRPDLIVETGTARGGSALFMASVCDLLDHGRVSTIDIDASERRAHPRIEYVTASSTAPDAVAHVREQATGTVLVVLDSDHSCDHVLAELRAYAPIVTPGSYLIVEDTNVNGHPVARSRGPGPMEAVDRFLAETSEFTIDRDREKFMHTFNPRGYLRRRW